MRIIIIALLFCLPVFSYASSDLILDDCEVKLSEWHRVNVGNYLKDPINLADWLEGEVPNMLRMEDEENGRRGKAINFYGQLAPTEDGMEDYFEFKNENGKVDEFWTTLQIWLMDFRNEDDLNRMETKAEILIRSHRSNIDLDDPEFNRVPEGPSRLVKIICHAVK